MKDLYPFLLSFFLLLQLYSSESVYSQQFTEGLKSKLGIAERNRLLEAEALQFKGQSKLQALSISQPNKAKLNSNPRNSVLNSIRELDAIVFLAFSNELKFNVLSKSLSGFHSNYKGNPGEIEDLMRVEKSMYDSVAWVYEIRKESDRERSIIAKFPLLKRAGLIEDHAILKLEKLLYSYLNLPTAADLKWIHSPDLADPYRNYSKNMNPEPSMKVGDTSYNTHLKRAMEIFNLMDISEHQLQFFNEFLAAQYPLPDSGVNFINVAYTSIDSLKLRWEGYLYTGGKSSDTAISNLLARIGNSKNSNLAGQDFLKTRSNLAFNYKIQVLASREKLGKDVIQKVYQGKEGVEENMEEGWYKYTIGNYKSYREARGVRDQLNIQGAFIVAYLNGKRIEVSTYTRFPSPSKPVKHEIGVK